MLIRFVFALLFFCVAMVNTAAAQTRPMIFLPFQEGQSVTCSQGNDGSHSHYGSMQYAYDFTRATGTTYGTDLFAPFSGTVREVVRTSTSTTGWGNTIVIQADATAGGKFVRLAHLAVNTIPSTFRVGTYVTQGQYIGDVGDTGESTGAHLHIQMMNSVSGSAIPFDFVEGPIEEYEDYTSVLRANRYVVDNRGRVSVGAPLSNISTTSTGTFSTFSWVEGVHGSDFRKGTSTGARFKWLFRLSLPSATRSPRVALSANCPYSSTHDTATRYSIARSSGSTVTGTFNQQNMGAYMPMYLTGFTAATGTSFTVTATRGNGRLCADSILVDLTW